MKLNGKTPVIIYTGVNFRAGTPPGTYTVLFTGVSGKYNDTAISVITVQ
jgi:hypothetical protein